MTMDYTYWLSCFSPHTYIHGTPHLLERLAAASPPPPPPHFRLVSPRQVRTAQKHPFRVPPPLQGCNFSVEALCREGTAGNV